MDWGRANDTFQTATVVFGLLAAVAAIGTYVTGSRVQASLRGKISQLEKDQQGRILTSEQLRLFAARLKALGRMNEPVYLEAQQGDREAVQLAKAIKQGFELAGFQVDGVSEQIRIAATRPGILIWQKSKDGHKGVVVMDALADIGLESRIVEVTRFDDQELRIIVSYKP